MFLGKSESLILLAGGVGPCFSSLPKELRCEGSCSCLQVCSKGMCVCFILWSTDHEIKINVLFYLKNWAM